MGSKSRVWGGALSLSFAALYIDWSNIQQDVLVPSSGFDFETNVGRARSMGLEFEARLKATQALTLSASGSVTDATFRQDTAALGVDSAGQFNVSNGDRVQGVPRYEAAMGFDYRFEAYGNAGGFVRGKLTWVGTSRGELDKDNPDYQRLGYFTAAASAGFTFERWEFSAFVKNAFDIHKIIQQPDIQGVPEVYQLRPRTVGLTARYDF